VRDAATGWLTSDSLAALAASLGGPLIRQVPRDLPAFLDWTADALDTRRGAERHQAAAAEFSPGSAAALISAAGPLGLLRTAPPVLPWYDVTVVLGGTVTGNLLRVALAASLPSAGVRLGLVAALAAHRPLTATEIAAAPHPVDETTEWQHLFHTICDAFGVATLHQTRHRCRSDFQTAIDQATRGANRELPLRLMAAPTTDPSRRANTADAIAFLAQRIIPEQRRRALVITSAIYAPYQFLTAAPRLLGDGSLHVEVIGTPTAVDGHRTLLAQRIGQEIHAAVTAAARLWP
jgi:hypothetical protein